MQLASPRQNRITPGTNAPGANSLPSGSGLAAAHTTRRVPALDGLRGVAIAMVLLHHTFSLPGGWAGVDLFFVLSGFLITGILLDDRRELHFWKIFYVRRATRILPAYLLAVGLAIALGLFPYFAWTYFAFFAANLANYRYDAALGPLGVLWSLAVEEHFYFVWPAVVRRLRDRTLVCLLLGVILLEPLLRLTAQQTLHLGWNGYYVLTPFRLDGLAMGSLIAILLRHVKLPNRLLRGTLPALGILLAIDLLCFAWLHESRFPNPTFFNAVGYTLVAATGALLLLTLLLRPNGIAARLLSASPLIFLGRVSYGAYVYHLLLLAVLIRIFHQHGFFHNRIIDLLGIALTLALASASFRFLETPFLALGRRKVLGYRNAPARL